VDAYPSVGIGYIALLLPSQAKAPAGCTRRARTRAYYVLRAMGIRFRILFYVDRRGGAAGASDRYFTEPEPLRLRPSFDAGCELRLADLIRLR
jgi:hypothetical protein